MHANKHSQRGCPRGRRGPFAALLAALALRVPARVLPLSAHLPGLAIAPLVESCSVRLSWLTYRSRWPFRRLLYSDDGTWPRSLCSRGATLRSAPTATFAVPVIWECPLGQCRARSAGAAGVCAIVGFYTRAALCYCWLHLYSMSYRCSGCQQAGDTLMRTVMFWSMFLPCGDVWSVDSALRPPAAQGAGAAGSTIPASVTTLACVGLLTQLGLIYSFCAMFKITISWQDGTAIDKVLKNFAFCTGLRASSPYNVVLRLLHAVPAMPL